MFNDKVVWFWIYSEWSSYFARNSFILYCIDVSSFTIDLQSHKLSLSPKLFAIVLVSYIIPFQNHFFHSCRNWFGNYRTNRWRYLVKFWKPVLNCYEIANNRIVVIYNISYHALGIKRNISKIQNHQWRELLANPNEAISEQKAICKVIKTTRHSTNSSHIIHSSITEAVNTEEGKGNAIAVNFQESFKERFVRSPSASWKYIRRSITHTEQQLHTNNNGK